MAIFMIERDFAKKLEPCAKGAARVNSINKSIDVRWLYSFLSADMKKTFCLYEAESKEEILEAAEKAGIPADVIVEVSQQVMSNGLPMPISA